MWIYDDDVDNNVVDDDHDHDVDDNDVDNDDVDDVDDVDVDIEAHSGVIYLKLQLEVLLLGNKTQVLRDLSGPSPLVNLYFKTNQQMVH